VIASSTRVIRLGAPVLVVCEGPSDCGLINALVQHHRLSGIEAQCPGERNIGIHGFSAIPKFLLALSTSPGWAALKGLFLVVDANGDPAARFAEAVQLMATVNCKVTNPFQVEMGALTAAVYLMPGPGRQGCLEHLLLDAIETKDANLIACVDSFASCVKLPLSWAPNDLAKMRVHSLITACCEEEPAVALSRVWSRKGNPIPVDSSTFTDLVNLLQQFARL